MEETTGKSLIFKSLKGEFVHFRGTIDTSRSKSRRMQLIIYIFV